MAKTLAEILSRFNPDETQKKLLREFEASCDDHNLSAKASFKEKPGIKLRM